MKATKEIATKKGILVQLRITSKSGDELNSYQAWDLLSAALKTHKELQIEQAEFRVEKEEEKTSF